MNSATLNPLPISTVPPPGLPTRGAAPARSGFADMLEGMQSPPKRLSQEGAGDTASDDPDSGADDDSATADDISAAGVAAPQPALVDVAVLAQAAASLPQAPPALLRPNAPVTASTLPAQALVAGASISATLSDVSPPVPASPDDKAMLVATGAAADAGPGAAAVAPTSVPQPAATPSRGTAAGSASQVSPEDSVAPAAAAAVPSAAASAPADTAPAPTAATTSQNAAPSQPAGDAATGAPRQATKGARTQPTADTDARSTVSEATTLPVNPGGAPLTQPPQQSLPTSPGPARPSVTKPESAAPAKPLGSTGKPAQTGRGHTAPEPASQTSTAPLAAAAASSAAAVAPRSPTEQVASALQGFVESAAPAPRASGSAVIAAAPTVSASPITHAVATTAGEVKSLTVDLDPGHLGPVTVTMRLRGDAMTIHIAVDNPETLRLLDRDKHLLSAAVVAAGGTSDGLRIGTDTSAGASSGFDAGGQMPSNLPGRQNGASSDASSTGRQAQNQGRQDGRNEPEAAHDDPTAAPAPASRSLDGGLYL